ncbi:MAG TPA: MotA/TolQ/ExbB proton channel family protein [Planctomycetota bacterium]|nr:MotA/TolQ/ExbB proton channel family protein [Planctomycetota bacterium]
MIAPALATTAAQTSTMPSLWELTQSGGPLMYPLAICSVVALAYAVERTLRTRASALGSETFGRTLVAAVQSGGPSQGIVLCDATRTPLSRVMRTALENTQARRDEREKRVEDVATLEVRKLQAQLRPLHLIYLVAPLLGLLGTVWGMIIAFATIALSGGLGKPGMLAVGVYQALVTTAAGLAIAIPTVIVYTWLRARIERFARRTEALYLELDRGLPVQGVQS